MNFKILEDFNPNSCPCSSLVFVGACQGKGDVFVHKFDDMMQKKADFHHWLLLRHTI